MNDDRSSREFGEFESGLDEAMHSALEERMRSASKFVQPSDSLRARVMDQARDWAAGDRAERTVLRSALAMACCTIVTLVSWRSVEPWLESRYQTVSSEDIRQRAHELAVRYRTSEDGSLSEAYREWRENLASRWKFGN